MSGNSVLVTGGLGNLGSWVSNYLIHKGFKLYILSNRQSARGVDIDGGFELISCDIRNLEELQSQLPKEIDYVVHLASFNEFFLPDYPKKALEINSLGTRNILQAIQNRGVKKFIYFSTFHIYGKSSGVISENTQPEPKNDYALTHLFAEEYVKQFHRNIGLPYTIFRLTNSYGSPKELESSKWYLVLNDLSKMAFEKREIVLNSNGKARRDFIYMGDVAKVIEDSFQWRESDTYNLGSGKTTSIIEIAQLVQKVYLESYGEMLNIKINRDDNSSYGELQVDIEKLQNRTTITFQNYFKEEIEAIFRLLEKI
jgi:UDP-glucose 4-epimerase